MMCCLYLMRDSLSSLDPVAKAESVWYYSDGIPEGLEEC